MLTRYYFICKEYGDNNVYNILLKPACMQTAPAYPDGVDKQAAPTCPGLG